MCGYVHTRFPDANSKMSSSAKRLMILIVSATLMSAQSKPLGGTANRHDASRGVLVHAAPGFHAQTTGQAPAEISAPLEAARAVRVMQERTRTLPKWAHAQATSRTGSRPHAGG